MSNTNFNTIIEQIKTLSSKELAEKQKSQHDKTSQFIMLCEKLQPLYKSEKTRVYNEYIKPFVDNNLFLCDYSVLRIIKKEEVEDCHTKILGYICDTDAKCGTEVLRQIISNTPNRESLCQLIDKGVYHITNEHQLKSRNSIIDNKRIDLLIVDDVNKWYIVIENKVNSSVHNASNTEVSQLDVYSQYCKSKFKDYKGYFILLSYKNNRDHIKRRDWEYIDYITLFKSLLPYYKECDIVKDYLKTLFGLLFNTENFNEYKTCSTLSQSVQFYNTVIKKTK